MKTHPITPARIDFDHHGAPYAPDFGDVYHARGGALAQAQHVFVGGNGLPQRLAQCRRFVVVETGFGLGHNFLATWAAFAEHAPSQARLHYIGIDLHPPTRADLTRAHRGSPLAALADRLQQGWPPLVHNLHRIAFDGARVELLLAFGDVDAWLAELVADVDAFFLDGFAPARNPAMWQASLYPRLARLAAPGATATTWSAARVVRDGLAAAGFEVERADGFGDKRDMTIARFAPRHRPVRSPGRIRSAVPDAIAVIGAGLAGCATARALADHGLRCTVFERGAAIAQQASAQPAGLFHGVVNANDGPHARFNRSAALAAEHAVSDAIRSHAVVGACNGLLRLADEPHAIAVMRDTLARLALPPDYVQACDAATASRIAGIALSRPALWFAGGGWVQPRTLCEAWLADAAPALRIDTAVGDLIRVADRWVALDEQGREVGRFDAVVLAGGASIPAALAAVAPLRPQRGQTTWFEAAAANAGPWPRVPIACGAYTVALPDGRILIGATRHNDDSDCSIRSDDHQDNLARARALIERSLDVPAGALHGRAGVRLVAADRLPVVGPVLAADAVLGRHVRFARHVPRQPGLFVVTALGSRGITWAARAGQTVAAWLAGAPLPLEESLLEAIDPARFVARRLSRNAGPPQVLDPLGGRPPQGGGLGVLRT